MKNLLFILFLSFTIFACNKNTNVENSTVNSEQTSLRSESKFIPFDLDFPAGTVITESNSTVSFTLPKSHIILGIDFQGNYHRTVEGGTGSVTCECTQESGGCNPTKIKGKYGCAMTTCSSCDKTNEISGVDVELMSMIIINPDNNSVIKEYDQLAGKKFLPQEYYNSPEFEEVLHDIQGYIGSPAHSNTMNVFMDIMGYIVMLEVPYDKDNNSIMSKASGSDESPGTAGIICSCNSPGSSCPKDGNFFAKWCDASNCKSCTLSGLVVDNDGTVKYMSVKDGLITLE